MEIKKGMFGKAKVKGEVVEVFIENLFKSDDVLVHAYCRFIGKNEWGGVYPEQFIETYHNPEHPCYLKWKQDRQAPKKRIPKTTIQWNHNTDEDSKGRYWG